MTVQPKLIFDPGPTAVMVAMQAVKDLPNVKEIIFLTNGSEVCMDGQDSRGRWFVPQGTIVIDVAECVRQLDCVRKMGMFITHNIWYNVLYAIYHEAEHTRQCLQNGWLKEVPAGENIGAMEVEANEKALELAFDWFEKYELPNLNGMGDLGVEIRRMRNSMYASDPHIEEEQKVWGTEAAGRADVFATLVIAKEGGSEECLYDRIDEGDFGCVIGGVRYLKATDMIAAIIADDQQEGL